MRVERPTEAEEHDQDPSKDFSVYFPDSLVFFPPGPSKVRIKLLDVLGCQYTRLGRGDAHLPISSWLVEFGLSGIVDRRLGSDLIEILAIPLADA